MDRPSPGQGGRLSRGHSGRGSALPDRCGAFPARAASLARAAQLGDRHQVAASPVQISIRRGLAADSLGFDAEACRPARGSVRRASHRRDLRIARHVSDAQCVAGTLKQQAPSTSPGAEATQVDNPIEFVMARMPSLTGAVISPGRRGDGEAAGRIARRRESAASRRMTSGASFVPVEGDAGGDVAGCARGSSRTSIPEPCHHGEDLPV